MKTYKIIFLDIDGVLNSVVFAEENYKRTGKPLFMYDFLDPEAVNTFVEFLKAHDDIRLVIDSSWRYGDYDKDLEFFKTTGLAPIVPYIVGVTARSLKGHRGLEINHFLEHHNDDKLVKVNLFLQGDKFDISDYVVVDDDDFDISDNLKDNFVHVDNYTGLTEADYSKIKFILNIP